MTMLTEKGRLQYGIEHDGQLHYDFEVRLPKVADNINALESVGGASGLRVETSIFASVLVSLGTIPKEQITYKLLAEGLLPEDYDAINDAVNRLKKKREKLNPVLSTSEKDGSSLVDTELQSSNTAT